MHISVLKRSRVILALNPLLEALKDFGKTAKTLEFVNTDFSVVSSTILLPFLNSRQGNIEHLILR